MNRWKNLRVNDGKKRNNYWRIKSMTSYSNKYKGKCCQKFIHDTNTINNINDNDNNDSCNIDNFNEYVLFTTNTNNISTHIIINTNTNTHPYTHTFKHAHTLYLTSLAPLPANPPPPNIVKS